MKSFSCFFKLWYQPNCPAPTCPSTFWIVHQFIIFPPFVFYPLALLFDYTPSISCWTMAGTKWRSNWAVLRWWKRKAHERKRENRSWRKKKRKRQARKTMSTVWSVSIPPLTSTNILNHSCLNLHIPICIQIRMRAWKKKEKEMPWNQFLLLLGKVKMFGLITWEVTSLIPTGPLLTLIDFCLQFFFWRS